MAQDHVQTISVDIPKIVELFLGRTSLYPIIGPFMSAVKGPVMSPVELGMGPVTAQVKGSVRSG